MAVSNVASEKNTDVVLSMKIAATIVSFWRLPPTDITVNGPTLSEAAAYSPIDGSIVNQHSNVPDISSLAA